MSSTPEERLARLEALFEMEETTAIDLKMRLTKIEDALQELIMDMHSAKVGGRIALGSAAVVGSIITVIITWVIQLKGST